MNGTQVLLFPPGLVDSLEMYESMASSGHNQVYFNIHANANNKNRVSEEICEIWNGITFSGISQSVNTGKLLRVKLTVLLLNVFFSNHQKRKENNLSEKVLRVIRYKIFMWKIIYI